MQPYQAELEALRQHLLQLRELLELRHVPQDVQARAGEVIAGAISIADDLLSVTPAAALGARGGTKTAERGAEYFKKIAGMRKTRAGGRPRKASRN